MVIKTSMILFSTLRPIASTQLYTARDRYMKIQEEMARNNLCSLQPLFASPEDSLNTQIQKAARAMSEANPGVAEIVDDKCFAKYGSKMQTLFYDARIKYDDIASYIKKEFSRFKTN